MKIDIYPDKAQYRTNEPVTLVIEIDQAIQPKLQGSIQITRLEKLVYEEKVELSSAVNTVPVGAFDTEFGGFGVTLTVALPEGKVIVNEAEMNRSVMNKEKIIRTELSEAVKRQTHQYYTSFDVVSDCSRAIRYGFLSDFHTEDGVDCNDVSNLRKFHINMVQYYDWAYRHDNLVSEKDIYQDLMGKEVDLRMVQKKINACKEYGMKSMAYGAVYAASREYFEEHKEMALYTSAGDPLVFIDTFYIMNVEKDCGWHGHIIEEYAKAVSKLGFDGIHMDTYGFPKTAYSYQQKSLIQLEKEYPALIADTKARLNEITKDNHLIFNNVGNWPVGKVAEAPQDAVYIEVWDPYCRYSHIRQIIKDAKRDCNNQKPVILAAYLAPFRTDTKDRAANAAYLLTAIITANGAYHLLLGEENAVLTQGYYVDHSIMEASVSAKLRSYYDFIVQYTELFYDPELADVSMTHAGWDNTEYRCSYDRWSVDADPGKVWFIFREKEERKLISLVNLCGNEENEWNRGKENALLQRDIPLQVQVDKPVKGIYFISPDYEHGKVQSLPYQDIKTDRGMAVLLEVPYLEFWSNVWIDF